MPEGDTAVIEEVEEKDNSLENFTFQDHKDLVPVDLHDTLDTVFSKQIYGWKKKARIILRMQSSEAHTKSIEDELRDACEGRSTARTPRSKEDIARTSLRNFLNTLEEDKLRLLCMKHSVSYDSFTNSNDKVGLVEALVDEMLN